MTCNELAAAAYAKAREAAEIVEGVPAIEIVNDGAGEAALTRLEEARNAILALATCVQNDVPKLAVNDMVTPPDEDLAREWGLAPFRAGEPTDPAGDVEREEAQTPAERMRANEAVVEHIPADACICGGSKRPRSDCWADRHDLS